MRILNDDVDFSNAPEKVKRSFLGPPRKKILKTDAVIYRFLSLKDVVYEDGTEGGSPLFESPWWVPEETFRAVTLRAYRTKRAIVPVARTGLSITREFNPYMDWILVARMRDPVWAWVGTASGQREYKDDSHLWLIGGLLQMWVPGLAGGGDGTSSPYAFMDHFGPIEA